jgi:hypothetical protein
MLSELGDLKGDSTKSFDHSLFPKSKMPETSQIEQHPQRYVRRGIRSLLKESGIVWVVAVNDKLLVATQSARKGVDNW